jgi:hypothetical protein
MVRVEVRGGSKVRAPPWALDLEFLLLSLSLPWRGVTARKRRTEQMGVKVGTAPAPQAAVRAAGKKHTPVQWRKKAF